MAKPKEVVKLCGSRRPGRPESQTCRHPAGYKTSHPGSGRCYLHGGASPMGEIHAERERAGLELRAMGRPIDIDPHEAILLCIRMAAGELGYATSRVNQLKGSQLLVRQEEELERPMREGTAGESPSLRVTEVRRLQLQLNIWVRIRHDAMDRLTRYSAAALRSGLEERLVKVAEIQGKLLADAVQSILRELGVADRPETPAVVRKHLLQIVSGPRPGHSSAGAR